MQVREWSLVGQFAILSLSKSPQSVWTPLRNLRRILLSATFQNFGSEERHPKVSWSNDLFRKTPPIFPVAKVLVLSAVWNNKFSNVGRFLLHPLSPFYVPS